MTSPSTTDSRISACLTAVRKGDQFAIGELWRYYEKRLRGLCQWQLIVRRCRGIEDADDIANQVFEIFVRKVQSGDLVNILTADSCWRILAKLSKDASCDVSRRYWRIKCHIDDQISRTWDTIPSVDKAFGQIDNRDWLETWIENCPSDLRRIISLALEGNTYIEIARILRLNPSTVYRKLKLYSRQSTHPE